MDPLHGLIREVLNHPKSQIREVALDGASRYFSALSRLDYSSAIRTQFDGQELRQVVSELRHRLPTLNRHVFAETNFDRLAKTAGSFGVALHQGIFEGPQGDTLRGFYVNDGAMMRRPVICLNMAHHRVSRAATFWHEMGHHFTREIFGCASGRLNLTSAAGYHKHLTDPQEILADVVLALAGYPKSVAARIFRGSKRNGSNQELFFLVPKVRRYLLSISGFDVQRRASQKERLNYLAGMIHIAKLRSTLLNEYGI